MKIVIVTFDHFTDLDVFLPWDILNRVRLVGNKQDWEVKIIGTEEQHISMAGLTIPVHGGLEEVEDADAVLFSSGIGVQNLLKNDSYFSNLKLNPEKQLIETVSTISLPSNSSITQALRSCPARQPRCRYIPFAYEAFTYHIHPIFTKLFDYSWVGGCLFTCQKPDFR